MRRRTQHEMDEWPDIRRPWHAKFWKFVYVWMAVVVLIIIVVPIWRGVELSGARVQDCTGIVKSIKREQLHVPEERQIVRAVVQVRGKTLEIPIDPKIHPDLRVGDSIELTCRIGKTGTLFVQKWRPTGGSNQ